MLPCVKNIAQRGLPPSSQPYHSMRPSLLTLSLVSFLVACGGGGGDGGDGTVPSGGGPVTSPTTSGLVPTAPSIGAVLFADATQFRPLAAGSVWTYRGTSDAVAVGRPYTPSTRNVYSNNVSQQASSEGVAETATNIDDTGSSAQTVSVANGVVRTLSTLDLGNGKSLKVDAIELRSPIRVDDQYTGIDTRVADGGTDFDGDGINDAIDVAVYSRVIGAEIVDLISAPQLQTVRVRTTLNLRVKYSKDDSFSTVITGTQDNWYASGVGIVQHVGDVPGPNNGSRYVTTEVLVTWDGVTKGLGYLEPVPTVLPNGTRALNAVDAVGFDSHALMMSFSGAFAAAGFQLTAIDSRGRMTASASYPGITATRAKLLRVGSAARVVAFDGFDLKMFSVDANGASTGAAPVTLRASTQNFAIAANDSREVVGASDGTTIWLAWIENSAPDGSSKALWATPFDVAGKQLAPATLLVSQPGSGIGISRLRAAGSADGVVFQWFDLNGIHYATGSAGALTLGLHTVSTTSPPSFYPMPVAWTSGRGLMWNLDQRVAGVQFDAVTAEPVRSNALGIEQENIALPWLTNTQSLLAGNGTSAKLDTFQTNVGTLWPGDPFESGYSIITEFSPGAGALATQGNARLLARGTFPLPDLLVSLPGSVLAIENAPGGRVSVTSVWRRQ